LSEGCQQPKVVSLAERRRCETFLRNSFVTSERRACRVMQLNRSSYRYVTEQKTLDERYVRVVGLSQQYTPARGIA
jgi:hypothetical protein